MNYYVRYHLKEGFYYPKRKKKVQCLKLMPRKTYVLSKQPLGWSLFKLHDILCVIFLS